MTANVNLWANPAALIANPDTLAALTDTQRDWVMQAGADAAAAVDRPRQPRRRAARRALRLRCPLRQRARRRTSRRCARRSSPSTPHSSSDPQTADFIARIEELKEETDPGPALDVPADCTGVPPLGRRAPPTPTRRRRRPGGTQRRLPLDAHRGGRSADGRRRHRCRRRDPGDGIRCVHRHPRRRDVDV